MFRMAGHGVAPKISGPSVSEGQHFRPHPRDTPSLGHGVLSILDPPVDLDAAETL
jgi:hypothetical protein